MAIKTRPKMRPSLLVQRLVVVAVVEVAVAARLVSVPEANAKHLAAVQVHARRTAGRLVLS